MKNLYSILTCFIILYSSFQLFSQCPPGNVILENQAEVDSFAINYPNCTTINGILRLGKTFSSSNITDVSGLSSITSIDDELFIINLDQIVTFDGFPNLVSVGGFLEFELCNLLEAITPFQSLTTIGDKLEFDRNPALMNIDAFPALTSIGTNFNAFENPNLCDCGIPQICAHLSSGGSAIINTNKAGCNSIAEVQASCNGTDDGDNDGFSICDGDCDDTDNTVYPGAPEICGDGIDNDCVDGDAVCPVPFGCSDNFYHLVNNQLNLLDLGTRDFEPIGNNLGRNVNAAGFNVEDNLIYAMAWEGNDFTTLELVIVDMNGEWFDRGPVIGLPQKNLFQADFDGNGNLLIIPALSDTLYSIDVDVFPLTATKTPLTSRVNVSDFSYNADDNRIYGIKRTSGATLISVDISTGEVFSAPFTSTPFGGGFGATWLTNDQRFYVFQNNTGDIYRIDGIATQGPYTPTYLMTTSPNDKNDGASCPSAIGLFCLIDSDQDGTVDCEDGCPNDSLKIDPGICGCGVSDADTDQDGVVDCLDSCPNDSLKTDPGVCGCGVADIDTDNDGTLDCFDGCPNDSLKTDPGICGCGIPDVDSDLDGTPDCIDACPADPNKVDPGICGCGVADIDTDNDGTPDCLDGCPDDPSKIDPGICGCNVTTCYCESYGASTQYEWIESIAVNGTANQSGNDGGYGDYTAIILPLSTGTNSIQLTPGFAGNTYREYWRIWIDFNQDGDFEDAGEQVYSNSSFYEINSSIDVPSSALLGETIMRISMSYGGCANPCDIFDEGEVEDYSVDIIFCDNITDGGAIGDDELLCDGATDPSEIVSISDASGGSGTLEYLWLKNTSTNQPPTSNNMNGWEEIPNSNNASYDPGPITQTTWYLRCARRNGCMQYPGESNVIEKTLQSSCTPEYCESKGMCSAYEWIRKVKVGSINNNTGHDNGYGDYTALSTTISAGNSYSIKLRPGFSGQSYHEYWRVWIDFNQDGDFTDSGEMVVQKKSTSSGTFTAWINVPSSALQGNTTMRVSMKYGDYSSSCETFNYGEVEDYTIEIGSSQRSSAHNHKSEASTELILPSAKVENELLVYPNPASDYFTIKFNEDNLAKEITIFDHLGKLILKTQTNGTILRIDTSQDQFNSGLYLLKIKEGGDLTTQRIVIAK